MRQSESFTTFHTRFALSERPKQFQSTAIQVGLLLTVAVSESICPEKSFALWVANINHHPNNLLMWDHSHSTTGNIEFIISENLAELEEAIEMPASPSDKLRIRQ
jgi:hypothetical protein